ncbi:MAG: hypothetical protein L6V93_00565 [Clostridiales bacterium]|nr:MAG: hypothetical protein L6V93_00565 [Clostridiales bacterium]
MYANEVSSAIFKEVILKIMRFAVFASTGTYNKAVRVIQYIEENYRKNITNEELSKISGYHPYHLNRLMQKNMQKNNNAQISYELQNKKRRNF